MQYEVFYSPDYFSQLAKNLQKLLELVFLKNLEQLLSSSFHDCNINIYNHKVFSKVCYRC